MKRIKFLLPLIVIFSLAFAGLISPAHGAWVPMTGDSDPNRYTTASPTLDAFTRQVKNNKADQLVGVYAEKTFAYPVLQQPADNPGYVSEKEEVVTQFRMASDYGVTGLLAHNYLAGNSFFSLNEGEEVVLVMGDGTAATYEVTDRLEYQALSPNSPYSDFIDQATGDRLSAAQVFDAVYTEKDTLVLQTCIKANGDPSWGRLFIIASPVK